MNKLLNKLTPFILAGIGIVALAFGIVLLAYLLFFGALIGLFLYILSVIRARFFAPKTQIQNKKRTGRIIDTDDFKTL